jgi:hypothetical protein
MILISSRTRIFVELRRLFELNYMLITAAAAFSPAGRVARSSGSSLKMQFEDELGVLPPVGFFDPLGKYFLGFFHTIFFSDYKFLNLFSIQHKCNHCPL